MEANKILSDWEKVAFYALVIQGDIKHNAYNVASSDIELLEKVLDRIDLEKLKEYLKNDN